MAEIDKVDASGGHRRGSQTRDKLISLNMGVGLPHYIAFHAGEIGNGF